MRGGRECSNYVDISTIVYIALHCISRLYAYVLYNVQSKQEMMQEISVASYLIILPNLSPALAQAPAPASTELGYNWNWVRFHIWDMQPRRQGGGVSSKRWSSDHISQYDNDFGSWVEQNILLLYSENLFELDMCDCLPKTNQQRAQSQLLKSADSHVILPLYIYKTEDCLNWLFSPCSCVWRGVGGGTLARCWGRRASQVKAVVCNIYSISWITYML